MSDRDPRKMAAQIAGVRAAETYLPKNERVFQDPYAEYFMNENEREGLSNLEKLRAGLAMYDQMMPGVNGAIVARIRFIDEYLLECIAAGFKQLVIIGAGYDTRAYRFEDVKENLKVNVTSASCKEKYFRNASCDRTVSPMFNFMHATVSSQGKSAKNLS